MKEEVRTIEEEVVVSQPVETEEIEVSQEEVQEVSSDEEVSEEIKEPEEEVRPGSVFFILDEETIKAHRMPRPGGTIEGERVAVSIPQENPWLTEQILNNAERFYFHNPAINFGAPVDRDTWRKVQASFDPLFSEKDAEPFKKVTPMGTGSLGARGIPGRRKFTGRGGQVHKVSESGEVLNELVDPPPPGLKDRLREVVNLARTNAADVLSSFREIVGEYLDEKLTQLEEHIRPPQPQEPPIRLHRRGTMGERFGKDRVNC